MSTLDETYRDLFDALDESCCILDVKLDDSAHTRALDCTVVAANPAFARLTGRTDTVGLGGRVLVSTDERYAQWLEIYGQVVTTGETARIDFELADHRWFETVICRLGAPEQRRILVRFTEISDRRTTERKHRDAQMRLETTLRAGEVGTWTWDIAEDKVYADRNLAQFFSLSAVDADGGPISRYLEAIHPDDRVRIGLLIQESLRTGDSYEAEYRLISPNKTERWVVARGRPELDETGVPLRLPGVVLDVTQARAAETALRISKARLHVALAAGRMGTWELDLTTHTLAASDTCKANYGVAADQPFTYETLTSAVFDEDRAEWQRKVTEAITEVEDFDHDYRTLWPDGSVHWVHVRGSCATNAEGHTISMSGVSTLIDERKRAEEVLRDADRQKDMFLATASHELRTPLNAILGWSRMLKAGTVKPEAYRRGIDTIERNAQAQVRLIEDILDGSRTLTGKLQLELRPVEMAVVVAAAIDGVKPSAEGKRIDLSVTLDPHASRMVGDPERLQQIVWNLANNAIKFTPKGGKVSVDLRRADTDIELVVSDSGEGISASFLPHVFERFRQADGSTTRRHGGLGLGLALVRYLAEAHGGSVRAESAGLGLGATFTVTLPVHAVAPAFSSPILDRLSASMLPDSALAREPLEGISVLVVDDEADARDLVSTVLRASGAEVRTAASAETALEALAERMPTVLVSDIGMPQVDGYELLRRVRSDSESPSCRLPAVALTAYARDEDRHSAMAAGFQAHLAKPVEPKELVRIVASLALSESGVATPLTT